MCLSWPDCHRAVSKKDDCVLLPKRKREDDTLSRDLARPLVLSIDRCVRRLYCPWALFRDIHLTFR